jgi:twitching motility two-component system response regulator PilG
MVTTMIKNNVIESVKELVANPSEVLKKLVAKEKSGKLIIQDLYDPSIEWIVYLGKGKIHFVTSKIGKRERLIYILSKCFPNHNFYIPDDIEDDYQFIYHQWQNKNINSKKARTILSYLTQEGIIHCLSLSKAKVQFEKKVGLDPLILNVSFKSLVNSVKNNVAKWIKIKEEINSPFVRLKIKNWEEIKTYFTDDIEKFKQLEQLKPYLDDQCSLYKIGSHSGKCVLELGLFFQPLINLEFLIAKPYQQVATVKKPMIACIDDSLTIQRILKMTLLTGGFDVISITEPARAMSIFVREKPDLILMDINMPEIDGYQLAYMMRQSDLLKNIPILMLTGRDGVMDRVKAKMVGAVGYICKPFNPQELLQSVHNNLQKNN